MAWITWSDPKKKVTGVAAGMAAGFQPPSANSIPNRGTGTQAPLVKKENGTFGAGTNLGNDLTKKTFTSSVAQPSGGGFTYGSDPTKSRALDTNLQRWATDPAAKQAEIDRTKKVIAGILAKDPNADISAQNKHLYGTLGYTDTQRLDIEPEQPEKDYSWLGDQYMKELEMQTQGILAELDRYKQDNQFAVDQNTNWLAEQMKKLEENRVKAGAEITNFQNRRGGLFSGGVDYQLATNNNSFTQAKENVTRDIGARNADIWSKYNQLASQASEKIKTLTSQAPSKIRELIEQQKAKDAAAQIEQAKVFGTTSDGRMTAAYQDQLFNQGITSTELQLRAQAQAWTQNMQQAQFDWDVAQQIWENTFKEKTFAQEVKQFAERLGYDWASLNQRDKEFIADQAYKNKVYELDKLTSGVKTVIGANGVPQDVYTPPAKEVAYDYKSDPDFAADLSGMMSAPLQAAEELKSNAQAYIDKYGYDGYMALLSAIKK